MPRASLGGDRLYRSASGPATAGPRARRCGAVAAPCLCAVL